MMYKILLFLLTVNAVVPNHWTISTAEQKNEFLKRFEVKSKAMKSIQSNYVQEKHMKQLKEPLTSSGVFYFAEPLNIRWEQVMPVSNVIVLTKDSVMIKGKEKTTLNAVRSNPFYAQLQKMMNGIINGSILESKDFEMELQQNQKQFLAKLIPQSRRLKKAMKKIELIFNHATLHLESMAIYDKSGDYSITYFKDVIENQSIPTQKFELK